MTVAFTEVFLPPDTKTEAKHWYDGMSTGHFQVYFCLGLHACHCKNS